MTGSKAVANAADSTNSPRSKARRHSNTWFAFTPCARATAPHSRQAPTSTLLSAASLPPTNIGEYGAPLPLPDP